MVCDELLAGCSKLLRSPFDALRATGEVFGAVLSLPFVLSLSKHGNDFFSNLLATEILPIVNFYLVRHGDAVSETLDSQRPLSRLGQEQVEQVARAAAARQAQVSAIFHSGILRAEQTAEIMARHLVPELGVRRITGLAPQDDPAIAKAELETSQAPLMFVGHLPHMSRLSSLLIHGDLDSGVVEFAPATLVCVVHEDSRWQLAWVLSPDYS